MAKYKLVIPKALPDFMTGQEMYDTLIAMGYEIPILEKIEGWKVPAGAVHGWKDGVYYGYGSPAFKAYLAQMASVDEAVEQFAAELESKFVIATWVVTGKVRGRKVWDWRIVENPNYSFIQFAQRLTGRYGGQPSDPIRWMSFQSN